MADAQKGISQDAASARADPSEAAASKLWAVYVSEAEKYDRTLVESWKSDMEGMLIFAGLFSASLTAFIIESYKALIPDSGDSTVQLLTQISNQLAASANGTVFAAPPPAHFTPSASSLVCNALWFISLGLSLTCALIATLLEQWAREFLHRAEMRSAPVIRARIFSYLYYGLKHFKMHAVVEIVPLLLHASLILFFTGLVAFLFPINGGIAFLVAGLSAAVLSIYALLTLMPLWRLDSPYRTPLSTACWRASRSFSRVWCRRRQSREILVTMPTVSPPTETIVEAISRQATEATPSRSARDYRALAWTVKSLADDAELQPFVETIPELLWGVHGRHHAYENHILKLMRDPDLHLKARLETLLKSCNTGILLPDASHRRMIICYKALWAIASVQTPAASTLSALEFSQIIDASRQLAPLSQDLRDLTLSADTMMQWSTFTCALYHLLETLKTVEANFRDSEGTIHNITHFLLPVPDLGWLKYLAGAHNLEGHWWLLEGSTLNYRPPTASQFTQTVSHFQRTVPFNILCTYLSRTAWLESCPYAWEETLRLIAPPKSIHPPLHIQTILNGTLHDVVFASRGRFESDAPHWLDSAISTLCSLWRFPLSPVPSSLVWYLNHRKYTPAILVLTRHLDTSVQLLSSFSFTLSNMRVPIVSDDSHEPITGLTSIPTRTAVMTALWRLIALTGRWNIVLEPILKVVMNVEPSSQPTLSVKAMLRMAVLTNPSSTVPDQVQSPRVHPLTWLLPKATAFPKIDLTDDSIDLRRTRVAEAQIALLAEFLEQTCSENPPYKVDETLQYLIKRVPAPSHPVHEQHQVQFARAFHRACTEHRTGADLLEPIIKSELLSLYASPLHPLPWEPVKPYAWLEDSFARSKIVDTLQQHAAELPPGGLLTQVNTIVFRLNSLHRAPEGEMESGDAE